MSVTPVNPNYDGSTADPKWVDGGPSKPEPTFNIDDPKMWLPMTVISGLASGFCERAAVVSGGKLTNSIDWDASNEATRSGYVSNCAANIAKGTNPATIANMYTAADATMSTPVSGTTTYMKTMDAMITKLIGAGGYVKKNGTAYADFDALKTAATTNIPAESALQSSITSDGGPMGAVMHLAYPAEWAKQRKWLLDELKYTPDPSPIPSDVAKFDGKTLNTAVSDTFTDIATVVAQARTEGTAVTGDVVTSDTGAGSIVMSNTELHSRTLSPSNWGMTSQATATTATVLYTNATITLTSGTDTTTTADNYLVSLHADGDRYHARVINSYDVTGYWPSQLRVDSPSLSNKTVTISLYLGRPQSLNDRTPVFFSSYINPSSIRVTGATTYTAANLPGKDASNNSGTLLVLSGGTANITGGSVYAAIVEPHGSMLIGAGATVTNCCILTEQEDNQVVSGYVDGLYRPNTDAFDAVTNLYQDFVPIRVTALTENTGSGVVIAEDSTYSPAQNVTRVLVKNGATCTLVTEQDYPGMFTVEPGGTLVIPTSAYIDYCVLLPGTVTTGQTTKGAVLRAVGSETQIHSAVYIHSGATCTFIPVDVYNNLRHAVIHSGGTCTVTPVTQFDWGYENDDGLLRVEEGAVVRVADTTVYSTDAALDATIIDNPRGIVEYRGEAGRDAVDNAEVSRFYTHGLKLAGTNTDLVLGWNSEEIVIPSGQTYGVIAATTGTPPATQPVAAPMFMGTNFTTVLDGFQIHTIKVTSNGVLDHYPSFRVRQFYNNPDNA